MSDEDDMTDHQGLSALQILLKYNYMLYCRLLSQILSCLAVQIIEMNLRVLMSIAQLLQLLALTSYDQDESLKWTKVHGRRK